LGFVSKVLIIIKIIMDIRQNPTIHVPILLKVSIFNILIFS